MKGKGCDLKQRLADLPDSGQREVCAQSRAFDAWDAQGTGRIERTTDTRETERTHFRLRVTSLVPKKQRNAIDVIKAGQLRSCGWEDEGYNIGGTSGVLVLELRPPPIGNTTFRDTLAVS
jgi:hypothetical protein